MQLDESIGQALSSPEPIPNLRALVKELFSRGADKSSVLAALENAPRNCGGPAAKPTRMPSWT